MFVFLTVGLNFGSRLLPDRGGFPGTELGLLKNKLNHPPQRKSKSAHRCLEVSLEFPLNGLKMA